MRLKKIIFLCLRVLLSFVLILFLLTQINKELLLETIKNSSKPILIFSFFLLFLNYLFCFFRWSMFTKELNLQISQRLLFIYFCGGVFFNAILPSSIGGDLVRSLDLSLYTSKTEAVLTSVILDRLSGYMGLILVLFFAMILGTIKKLEILRQISILLSVLLIMFIFLAILMVLFNQRIFNRFQGILDSDNQNQKKFKRLKSILKSIYSSIYFFRYKPVMILKNIFLSFIIQALGPLIAYTTALALGMKIDFLYFFIIIPIIGAISMLPISLGGLGLREGLGVFFFGNLGISKELAFSFSFIGSIFLLIYSVLAGIIYVIGVRHRRV